MGHVLGVVIVGPQNAPTELALVSGLLPTYCPSMAELKEIAIGIAQVIQFSDKPEPLPIELWNEPPSHAANLVRHVIDECMDAGVRLQCVKVDEGCWQAWVLDGVEPSHRGVPLRKDPNLQQRLEFYRFAN